MPTTAHLACSTCRRPISGRYLRWDDGTLACAACLDARPRCARCGKLAAPGERICAACRANADRCGGCQQILVGRYAVQDGMPLCATCLETLDKCARCGRVVVAGHTHMGHPYCPSCFTDGERCALCHDLCRGRFWNHPRLGTFCDPCRGRATSCARCGVPTLEPRTLPAPDGPLALCEPCWLEAPTCHACGNALTGQYFTHSGAPDRRFCAACMDKAERCDFCGVPLTERSFAYPDGRISCTLCRSSAILDPAGLVAIERRARNWMFRAMNMRLRPSDACPIHLASADEIARVQSKTFVATPGFDRRERGLFLARVQRWTLGPDLVSDHAELAIYVETGIPLKDALGTMVHELTHLWQFDHFPFDTADRQWIEGLACWTQYHALLDHNAPDAARMVAENPDPLYGGGFARVQQIERRVGRTATLDEVRRRVNAE